jgi:hypothetical protein
MEGIVAMAMLAVDGLTEVYLVEQFVVKVYADVILIPIHAPDVELCCPKRVFDGEVREGFYTLVPYASALIVAPTCICQYAGHTTLGIVFHDIYFSA